MDPSAEGNIRPLAEVEADLLNSEKAYQDAATRMDEARRDLDAALRLIDQHQAELDSAVAALRERSAPGSRWRASLSSNDELLLSSEHMSEMAVAPALTEAPNTKVHSLSVHFERLREVAKSSSTGGDAA